MKHAGPKGGEGIIARVAWVTHHEARATRFSGNTGSQQFQKWLFPDLGACLLELADLVAEEGLGDLTLWVPYGKWPHQGKESRQDGRSGSLEIGKCGPRTMVQQALGSCGSCLCHYEGQSAWPQWKRRSHATAPHLWSALRVSLFSLSLSVATTQETAPAFSGIQLGLIS